MAETTKTGSQTSELNKPASKQASSTSKTEEAAEAEVPGEKTDEPEEDAEGEEEPAALDAASLSSSKAGGPKVKTSHDKISTISSPSVHSNASQQDVTVNQLVNDYLPRSLNEISDDELLAIVINLDNSILFMRIENEILERHIRSLDPKILEDFNDRLEHLLTRGRHGGTKRGGSTGSAPSSRGSVKRDNTIAILESGPRITLTTKSDILETQKAVVEESLNHFHAEMQHKLAELKASEEEAGTLTLETIEAINMFERMCVDPPRIPAEKFIRYIQECLKTADSTIEKLRLHTTAMHQKLEHVKRLIQECKTLRCTIQPVDFEQMKIENALLSKELVNKNRYFLELKYLAGKCSLMLVQSKNKLMEEENQKQALIDKIEVQKGKIKRVQQQHEVTKHKLKRAEPKLESLREFIDTHECPNVKEYIRTIDEVHRLQQEIIKWERRHGTQSLTLQGSTSRIKTPSFHCEPGHQNEAPLTSRPCTPAITEESFM